MPPLLRLLLASLAAAAAAQAQEQPFVSAWPENPVVEFGGSLILNCSTTCQTVTSRSLETSLEKEDVGEGPTWKAFRLDNITDWDPVPSCYFKCAGFKDVRPHRVNITVYRAPTRVELDPVPEVEVGKAYDLTCRVSNVAPIRNLSVTFLKGGQKLHTRTFEKHVAREANDVVVKQTLTAEQHDHGEEVSCSAALDLRPEGPLFEVASHNQSLKAIVFPTAPRLSHLSSMEVNINETVTCEVTGVFPAEEAQFELTFGEERLTFDMNVEENRATARALVLPSVAGDHTLKCTVSLGPVTRTAEGKVNVYSLPGLVLTISPQGTPVDNHVDVVCEDSHPQDTQPHTFSAQIQNSKGVLESSDTLPLRVALMAGEEDNGEEFTCQVELVVDGRPVRRKTAATLTVFYGPKRNDSSCPSTLTWKAGSEETFTCLPSGNPPAEFECRKDGVPYALGVPQQVTIDHQGNYICNASNNYGSVTALVTVHVEVYEPPTLLICLVVLAMVIVASIVGVAYYMYYRSHKIKKYRLQKKKAQGSSSEKKCLNGNVQTASV